MNIPYMHQEQYLDALEVEDIGNVIINALSDEGEEYYLSIQTSLGWSIIQTYGPLTADINTLGNYFNYNYMKFEYNEKKLFKIVNTFLNDGKKMITQALIIDEETFNNRLKELTIAN